MLTFYETHSKQMLLHLSDSGTLIARPSVTDDDDVFIGFDYVAV